MGWLFSSAWPNASSLRNHLRDELKSGGNEIVDDALTSYGRHYWALVKGKDGKKTIFLALLEKGRADVDGGWGYKDMDEGSGPYEVDVPLRLLDAADEPPNEWAKEWRAKVRAFYAKKAEGKAFAKTLVKGAKVALKPGYKPAGTFTVASVKPLRAYHDGTGMLYRLRAGSIVAVEEHAS